MSQGEAWYRGTEHEPRGSFGAFSRFAYYSGAKPDPLKGPVTKEIEKLYKKGKIRTIRWSSGPFEFKISRTYEGMSNYGFGVYFSNDLDWALRYGRFVTFATIDPRFVAEIDWDERDVPGTPACALMSYIRENAEDSGFSLAGQAPLFSKGVKRVFGRDKRALFVRVNRDGSGQLVSFSKDIIRPVGVAEFYE